MSGAFNLDIKPCFFTSVAWVNQQNGCMTFINGLIWKYQRSPRVAALFTERAPDWLRGHVFCWLYITIIKQCIKLPTKSMEVGRLIAGSINLSPGKLLMWNIWKRKQARRATKWRACTVNMWTWVIYCATNQINQHICCMGTSGLNNIHSLLVFITIQLNKKKNLLKFKI